MRKSDSTRLSGFVFGALALILLLTACGGGRHHGSPTSASVHPQPQPQIERSVAEVLAELDAMTAPPQVDSSVFAQLKEALRAELLARFSGKIVSEPPMGAENEITDFAFQDNGDGTYSFDWSYVNVGDYNQDSIANIMDITPLAAHFNEESDPENEVIDGNRDGAITILDVTPLAAHFFNDVGWYSIQGAEAADGTYEEIGTVLFSEGAEGSRLRFSAIFPVGAYRFFQVIAYSAAGLPGAGSRRVSFGPTAQAHAEAEGCTVQFYGVGSTCHGGNVAFMWDFESDGTFDTAGAGTGLDPDIETGDQSPLHTYPNEGTYLATLRVYDAMGNYSEAEVTVAAYDSQPSSAAPSLSALVLDLTGETPFHVRFRSFSNDPDGGDILLYTWDFGDGSPIQTNATIDHTYTTPGLFTVQLMAEDEEAQLSHAQLVVRVCPAGSIPDLHPSAVNVPEVGSGSTIVGFVGQSADMDGGPDTYMWDFGDNSPPDTTQDPNHDYSFTGDGVYYATAHVHDDEGNHSSAGSTFIIGNPTDELPSAFVVPYITSGTQNMLVQFFGNGEFVDGRGVEYSWDFDGDGTYDDYSLTDRDPIVAYTAVGNYQVGFKVMDAADHNKYSTASATITVHPCLMPTPPPPPPPDIPTVPIPTPPPLGTPINARCHPCPLSMAHGPDGATLWVIYTDNGGLDPLAAGYPSLSQIQQFAPNPVAPWLWGPRGEIDNTGNGDAGADIAEPYPPGTAPAPPPGANVKPGESWTAYKITRPKDGPPRVERLDFKFHLKRADGSAFASQTCIVYVYHAVDEIQEPLNDEYVSGNVTVTTQVDPTGTDATIGFIDLDPGDQTNVYLEVDGAVVGEMTREGETSMWSCIWDSRSVMNGSHTLTVLLYDSRDPQPGEPDDPGPFWESEPVTVNVDNGPPMETAQIDLAVDPPGASYAGDTTTITVTTLDGSGTPVYESFLDVFVEISPKRSTTMSQLPEDVAAPGSRTHERILQLNDNGDGTYTHDFTWEVSGIHALSAIVVDTRIPPNGDKVPSLVAELEYEIMPGVIGNMELCAPQSVFGPVCFYGQDSWGNVYPYPNVADFMAWTDNFDLKASPPQMLPTSASIMETHLSATNYGVGTLTVEHPLSGSIREQFVGYPPWRIHMGNEIGDGGTGFPADSFFDVYFDLRIPDGFLNGWQNFEVELVWPDDAPIVFQDLWTTLPALNLTPAAPENDGMGWWHLNVGGGTTDLSEFFGEQTAFAVTFYTDPAIAEPYESVIGIAPGSLVMQDSTGLMIPYDPMMFMDGFYDFYFYVKPTKTLNMHIYRVEGSATDAEINDDVQAAESMFNINAFMCTLGFYVDFNVTITTIPLADWSEIDEDGDGLDRYDANDDGDYADEGDNNDLFNAMNKDYYDGGANTENIYYVPGIRGGALGTTYWPNSQVAVDNGADPDNLTLAHEKVHELDLRKDGDFDVLDGADMNDTRDGIQKDAGADTQGAYGAGNIMNYGDTGMGMTPEQARNLDP